MDSTAKDLWIESTAIEFLDSDYTQYCRCHEIIEKFHDIIVLYSRLIGMVTGGSIT